MKGAQSSDDAPERLMLADLGTRPHDAAGVSIDFLASTPIQAKPKLRPRTSVRARFASLSTHFVRASALEADRGAVFLLAPVMLCIGSLAYFSLPLEPGWLPVVALAAIATLLSFVNRNRQVAGAIALAALLLIAGGLAAKFETWRMATRVIGGEISTYVTGRVELIEERENGRIRLTLTVLGTERPKLRYQPDRIRLTARKAPAGLRPGMVVAGLARLTQPLGPLRPGSYDFAFENYFDAIGATGFFLRDPILADGNLAAASMLHRVSHTVENMRDALARHVRNRIEGDAGEIAAALIAGVRAGIPEKTNEVLRITGLAHVLSISGLHMALVAGVVIGTMRFGFALFPAFASNYPVRKFAAAGALLAVAIYLLISGAAIAAQRSFLMIAVMLIALLFDRSALTMRNLAIAALAILLVAPHEAAGPSFQMSFAATAALIAAYGWWQQREGNSGAGKRPQRGILISANRVAFFYVVGLVATALIAGSATGIFGAWHFQRVSPLGVPANLLTMPIVSVLVMPFAVLGVLLIPFGLDGPAFWVMGKGLDWMIDIAAWLAVRTPVDAIGSIPVAAVISLALALVPLTLATTTAWRATALPFIATGATLLLLRDLPTTFVSEDARLMGVRLDDGRIAVNRERPNSFVLKDWQRAMMAGSVVKPVDAENDVALFRSFAAFACRDGLCVLVRPDISLAHATTMQRAERACGKVSLIVIEDATAANPCPHSETKVISARTFALRGSAQIQGAGEIAFALPETARPWHEHRRFSRAARGIAPYVPKSKKTDLSPDQQHTNAQPDPEANGVNQ
jgi:ComEC/Rec2-related protein